MMHTRRDAAETRPWFTILEVMDVYIGHLTPPFQARTCSLLSGNTFRLEPSFLRQFPEYLLEDLLAIVQVD